MKKEQIRQEKKSQRNILSIKERDLFDKAILARLLKTEEYKSCSCLFCFISFGSEINTHNIIRQAFLDGKRVYAPRVQMQGMNFYEIKDLEGLIPSRFGVLEPIEKEENRYDDTICNIDYTNIKLDNINLMLLPGLAFDLMGNRIGYGAGYYDRYLDLFSEKHFYKIALAYDFQIMEAINADAQDIKVDAIVTPTRRIQCR